MDPNNELNKPHQVHWLCDPALASQPEPKIETELERLRKENDTLRKFIAESNLDCIYCGLSKADMAKCEHGFPGCGRADDLMA